MKFFKLFVVAVFYSTHVLASGTISGGGGKSATQAQGSSSQYESKINELRKRAKESRDINSSFDHNHKVFSQILQKNIYPINKGTGTQLDYKNVNRKKLNAYIAMALKQNKKTVDSWSREKQLAYYFNLYNALTIELILKNYPLNSIRDLGSGFPLFQSPWKKKFFKLFGKMSHLDNIEHTLTRGNEKLLDPLVHFAFNCASIGCPALLSEAFSYGKLESQLQYATKNFLKDRSRNYIKGNTVYASSIFKWYTEDFEKGLRNFHSLKDFFKFYKKSLADNKTQLKLLESKKYDIEFLDYDWNLNDKR